jgi:hypothetical protein
MGGGGAVLAWTNCNPHFVNCTFADNYAVDAGGAVEVEIESEPIFTNCIFWGNTADVGADQISIWDLNESALNVYYSDVEGGLDGITTGFSGEYLYNINEDPGFKGFNQSEFPPYFISDGTGLIGGGTIENMYLPEDYIFPEFCLGGNPRIWNEIDMGSYEYYITGTGDIASEMNQSFNVFPNPINKNPTIEFYIENETPIIITVSDIHGKVIAKNLISNPQTGKNRISWNTNELAPGVYFIKLNTGNQSMTRKIIKIF